MSRLEIRLNLPDGMVYQSTSAARPRAMQEVTGREVAGFAEATSGQQGRAGAMAGSFGGQAPVTMTLNRAARRRTEKLQRDTATKTPVAK